MGLRPDISTHPSFGEHTGGRLGAFSRGFHRLWWGFFEVPESAGAGLSVAEAGGAGDFDPEVIEGGTAALDDSPVRVDGQGNVVDMRQVRDIRDARAEVAASFETRPGPETPTLDLIE